MWGRYAKLKTAPFWRNDFSADNQITSEVTWKSLLLSFHYSKVSGYPLVGKHSSHHVLVVPEVPDSVYSRNSIVRDFPDDRGLTHGYFVFTGALPNESGINLGVTDVNTTLTPLSMRSLTIYDL